MEINDLITILVEQNKSFIEQNKSYKEMLLWAMTSIITLLVIFLTANFVTMRKFRDEELERIQSTVLQNIQNNSIPELKKELDTHLELLVKTNFNSLQSDISRLKSQLETTNSSLRGSLGDFKKEVKELEGKMYFLEGDFSSEQGIFASAFSYYLEAGNAFLEADSIGHIYGVLSSLEKTVEKLPYITSDLADFIEFSSQLGMEFQPQSNKIADLLKGIRQL